MEQPPKNSMEDAEVLKDRLAEEIETIAAQIVADEELLKRKQENLEKRKKYKEILENKLAELK